MRVVHFRPSRLPLFITSVIAVTVAAVACGGGHHGPTKIDSLKIDQTVNLPDLDGKVDVVRDEFGRPHVYATTIHDLAEVTGWLHAEDRYIQMDLQRRVASSRLADLVGAALPTASDVDRQFHVYGLSRAAQKIYDALPAGDDLKIALDAYAVGVNAKVATFTTPPAPEYTVFQYPFAQSPAWTPVDSLSVGRLLAYQLDWTGDEEVGFANDIAKASTLSTGLRAGFVTDTFLHFTPSETISIVNPTMNFAGFPQLPEVPPLPRRSLAGARARYEAVASNPLFSRFMHRKDLGSNDWVVSGAKTTTHHPILCNDPHLSLSAPPVWYELHWNTTKYGGALDVTGVSFPGIPAIILGGNGHVAWGVTNVGPDATDTYVEHYSIGTGTNGADQVLWDDDGPSGPHAPAYVSLVKDTADIVVRQPDGSTTTIVDTIWLVPQREGVIIPGSLVVDTSISLVTGTALSWSWTGFRATHEFETFFLLAHAHNAADVIAADANFETPPQNMVYADSAGNIGYTAGGWYPVRGDDDGNLHTDPPYLPMPGYNGAHEWTGRLDATQWPHEENPVRGWEASANQDPIGTNFDGDVVNDPVYLGALDWDIGFRGARIARSLNGSQNIDVGSMEVLQADHHSNWGERMLAQLLPIVQATHPNEAQMLAAWGDRGYHAASGVGSNVPPDEIDDAAATSLFNTWMVAARYRAFSDEEQATGVTLDMFTAARTMLFLLEHPDQSATFDVATGESILWDDMTTPQREKAADVFNAALGDALAFLASPQGFNSADPTDWRWGLLHTLNLERISGLSPFDIPKGVDAAHYPNGYPRHSDLFNVDVGNFGLGDDVFDYTHGASMREIIDLTPGRMRMYNQIPGGISADPQSKHYRDRAEEYAKNITRETWYREADVAGHGTSRVQFTP